MELMPVEKSLLTKIHPRKKWPLKITGKTWFFTQKWLLKKFFYR
jgi:hypothetical protein